MRVINCIIFKGSYIWELDNKKFIAEATNGKLCDTLTEAKKEIMNNKL